MKTSIDHWFAYISGKGDSADLFKALTIEMPPLVSLILDRSCRFQCKHCIFQPETSSGTIPKAEAVLRILKELKTPKVVHEGRQLTASQLPLLGAMDNAGYEIGIIESGTYTRVIDNILQSNFKFSWMDISIDGPKQIHNLQRANSKSWDIALEGIRQARTIIKPKGKLTSLMTLTSLNYAHVSATSEIVFAQSVDEWHVTTMSLRPGLEKLRASYMQIEKALCQMKEVSSSQRKMFLRVYNLDDMHSLVSIFGKDTFAKLLKNAKVTQNALVLDVGFPLFFYPTSLVPCETLVIDVDGWWRLPYSIKYTLEELKEGRSIDGEDISVYSITEIDQKTNAAKTHRKAAAQWQKYRGEQSLLAERALFQNLF